MAAISDIIFSGIEGVAILLIYLTLMNKKDFLNLRRKEVVIFTLSFAIFTFWITLSLPLGYHTVVVAIFTMVILSLVTRTKYSKSFLPTLIAFIFIGITEIIVVFAVMWIFNLSMSEIVGNIAIIIKIGIFIKPIQITLAILAYKFINISKKSFINQSKGSFASYLVLGIFLIAIFIISFNYMLNNPEQAILYQVLLVFLFIIYIALGVLDFQERIKLTAIESKFQVQKEYVYNLEAIISIIRREKHDFANHINTIYAMCKLNKPNTVQRIESYLEKLATDINTSYNYFDTGNDYIDGLLAVKSNLAHQKNIYFEVDFEEPIDSINIEDKELISIISNIIDNAFDAIIPNSENEKNIVSICTYIEEDKFVISISNNGPRINEQSLNNIFNEGYSTKSNSGERGFGLYIVKEIVTRNGGEIKVLSSDVETEFVISFNPIKDKEVRIEAYANSYLT